VLSYNIQVAIATQRYRQYVMQGWKHLIPHQDRIHNLEAIARLVRDYDLVGLQEVDAGSLRTDFINQTEFLARRGRFPHWLHQTNRRIGNLARHSNGLLARFAPATVEEHKLPGLVPGRGALCVTFGAGSEKLTVITVHLALLRRSRQRQLGYIHELVQTYRHAIVMGDLNVSASDPDFQWFLRVSGMREPPQGLMTFPSWQPRQNLDHILVSGEIEVIRTRVLNFTLSDHLPVSLEMMVPPEVRLERTAQQA
jgi:endonuclease/exonuclease/phosphatase family metal-dependent hydrolase